MFFIEELRFIFLARVVILCRNLVNSLLAHLHLDIPLHLLRCSNKGQNSSAGIELKTCFLLYYKIKSYKAYLAVSKND